MHDDEYGRYITKYGYINLSIKENLALKVLLKNRGRVVSYEELSNALYRESLNEEHHYCIRNFVNRLRKKLKGEVEIKIKCSIGYYIN